MCNLISQLKKKICVILFLYDINNENCFVMSFLKKKKKFKGNQFCYDFYLLYYNFFYFYEDNCIF